MSHSIACYRCGFSLASLSLPLSRRDECPGCGHYLHVCRMCVHFEPSVPKKCREDDAEEVIEKERPNFCDYYEPSERAFDPNRKVEEAAARGALDALFGGEAGTDAGHGDAPSEADKLFK